MIIGLMQGIGIFYYWTWFVWPFVFVFSFTNAISTAIKEENASLSSLMSASISLLIILAGIAGTLLDL